MNYNTGRYVLRIIVDSNWVKLFGGSVVGGELIFKNFQIVKTIIKKKKYDSSLSIQFNNTKIKKKYFEF